MLGVEVLTTYAMTESMPIASNPRRGERRLRSVGFAGGPEVMVLMDPPADCRPVAPGSEGHVCVRGACVTAGYEYRGHMGVGNNPNDEAFTAEGFLCTGDKGYIDSAGHLVLVGRFKEIINRGGEKISPFEVEDALLGHAAVRDMICFAMPHELYGEVVGAAVVLRAGVSLTLDELRGFGERSFTALTVRDLNRRIGDIVLLEDMSFTIFSALANGFVPEGGEPMFPLRRRAMMAMSSRLHPRIAYSSRGSCPRSTQ